MPPKPLEQTLALGRALARRRLELDLTQREIAERLGYRQASFITQVEGGHSAIPPTRLFAFVQAYEWPATLAVEALRRLYPETYTLLRQACEVLREADEQTATMLWAKEVGHGD